MARARREASVPIGFLYLKTLDLVKMVSFRTYFHISSLAGGQAVAHLFQALHNKVRFPMVSFEILIGIILPAALSPWSRLSL